MAFRKFAARRSLPSIMISDNGSIYLSAAEELRSLLQLPEIKEELAKKGVSWRFIPKRTPCFGGFWEHLIGLPKTAIKKVLGRRHVSLLTLETIVVKIEAILNDRPLTFVLSELGDPEPLTPTHLLHGCRITCLPHQHREFVSKIRKYTNTKTSSSSDEYSLILGISHNRFLYKHHYNRSIFVNE